MNNLENNFANHVGEAEVLKSTFGWHATMTTITTIATVFIILAVAAWEIA